MLMEHLENPSNVNEKEIMLEQEDVTALDRNENDHPTSQKSK